MGSRQINGREGENDIDDITGQLALIKLDSIFIFQQIDNAAILDLLILNRSTSLIHFRDLWKILMLKAKQLKDKHSMLHSTNKLLCNREGKTTVDFERNILMQTILTSPHEPLLILLHSVVGEESIIVQFHLHPKINSPSHRKHRRFELGYFEITESRSAPSQYRLHSCFSTA